jgi:hypothetical protein
MDLAITILLAAAGVGSLFGDKTREKLESTSLWIDVNLSLASIFSDSVVSG